LWMYDRHHEDAVDDEFSLTKTKLSINDHKEKIRKGYQGGGQTELERREEEALKEVGMGIPLERT
jgi:hypothetical protein